jgi:hypothetical protein
MGARGRARASVLRSCRLTAWAGQARETGFYYILREKSRGPASAPARTRRRCWTGKWNLEAIPATYVLDSTGLIVLSYLDADYTTRLETNEIIVALTHLRAAEHSCQE